MHLTTRIIFVVFNVFCLHHPGEMFQNMLRSHTAHAASISQASPVHTSAASTTSNASPGPPSDHCCREAPRPLVLPECPVQSLSPNSEGSHTYSLVWSPASSPTGPRPVREPSPSSRRQAWRSGQ